MKQLFFLLLFLAVSQSNYAQNNYDKIVKEESFETLMLRLNNVSFETETDAAELFEKMSQQDKFIKEKELWNFLWAHTYSANFMEKVNESRIAKLMMNEYQLQFIDWYGEQQVLNHIEYLLNIELWAFADDIKAIDKFLTPLCKDQVQVTYIRQQYLVGYIHEMTSERPTLVFDYKTQLEKQLQTAKKDSEKAKIYKDAARLACLFDGDMQEALAWAEMSKKLQADKEIYYVLANIYTNMARKK